MELTDDKYKGRFFKIWQFDISHQRLLVRSPRRDAEEPLKNIDIRFFGVDYMDIEKGWLGLHVVAPTDTDMQSLTRRLGRTPQLPAKMFVLVSADGRRQIVVAASMEIEENELDIMESSLEKLGMVR